MFGKKGAPAGNKNAAGRRGGAKPNKASSNARAHIGHAAKGLTKLAAMGAVGYAALGVLGEAVEQATEVDHKTGKSAVDRVGEGYQNYDRARSVGISRETSANIAMKVDHFKHSR